MSSPLVPSHGGRRPRPSSIGPAISYARDSFTVGDTTVTVMFLAGEIDVRTEHAVYDALGRLLDVGSDVVVVDLGGVCTCSIGGYGMLVEAAAAVEAGGGHFALVSGAALTAEPASLGWPDRSFSRHPTFASAIAAVRDAGRRGDASAAPAV